SPFLGTIGVAPRGERRLSYVQGPDFLGNTDLPLNGIGATIVMRANVPGGLVSFGDAHAVQGDGEISGAAIECQADVTVRLERIAASDSQYVALPQVNTTEFIGSLAAFPRAPVCPFSTAGCIVTRQPCRAFPRSSLLEAAL